MAEPIFSTWVKNKRENTLILAGYILPPQVPIFVNIYKFSDLKTVQNYATMNVIELQDNPATSSGIGTGIVSGVTPTNLDTVTEIAAQMTYIKQLVATDFAETSPGSGKWIATIDHLFGRIPNVKIVASGSVVIGDIIHNDTFTSLTITLSQRIPCAVHLS